MATMKYNGAELTLDLTSYSIDDTPAIMAYEDGDPYGVLTVNLDDPVVAMMNMNDTRPVFYQYVDTNNLPGIDKAIEEAEIGESIGVQRKSGFCIYPLFKFHMEEF